MARPRRSRRQVSPWHPKLRRLVVLSDQGESKQVSPSCIGSMGRDQGWSSYAESFISANRYALGELDVHPELSPEDEDVVVRLRPGERIGAVPLHSAVTRKIVGGIVVKPRFGWGGIGELLQNIGWSAAPRVLGLPLVPGSAREIPPWVLAGPVLQRLGRLLREIRAGFRVSEDVLESPRGQVIWSRYLERHLPRGTWHQFPCRYPDLLPDLLLQQHLKWGIERVRYSLAPFAIADTIARRLLSDADDLLYELRLVKAFPPDHRSLDQMLASSGLPSASVKLGVQALSWLVDERGLAGQAEADGLAWALPMHALFERWVESLTRSWARQFGGEVRSARDHHTLVPIRWDSAGGRSLGSLEPDLTVRTGEHVVIIDAKYKGHFEELDERRWAEVSEEMRESHRHDLHQVLAYAALFDAPSVTTALVYPMQQSTWAWLSERNRTMSLADVTQCGRRLRLALIGVPLHLPPGQLPLDVVRGWDRLREEISAV